MSAEREVPSAEAFQQTLELLRSQQRLAEAAAASKAGAAGGAGGAGEMPAVPGLPGGRMPDITPDELNQLSEAFTKPEFRKLFQEYVDEVSDPKVRAETEAHLKQLEEAGETPKDLKLVKPKPGFALECKMKDEFGGYKVYVNVVVSGARRAQSQSPERRRRPRAQAPHALLCAHARARTHASLRSTTRACFRSR
jgi:hypothetical protein